MFPITDAQLFLKAMMLSASDELYLLDAASMQLVYASENAQKSVGNALQNVKPSKIYGMLGVSQDVILEHVQQYKSQANFVEVTVGQDPVTVKTDNHQLRVMLLQANQKEYILVIKNDLSANEKTLQALNETEARFQAIVANTPGMVFQFKQGDEGEIAFIYLSGGSKALLGIESDELCKDSGQFYAILNARDRATLRTRLKHSASALSVLDWEGRVWIDGWQDTKWVNMRATPKKLSNGDVIWDGIMFNITNSKNEKLQLEQSRRELADLTAHINTIREDERKKIAREIHDDLGGNLTAIKMGLATLIEQPKLDQGGTLEHAKGLLSIVDNTFATVHKISGNLRPNILDLGIVDAIEWQTKEFKKQLVIPCKFSCNRAEISTSTEQSMALFRICQEAMSNIAKYAQATEVHVDLNATDHEVVMTISDNGVGIKSDDKLKTDSFGLRGMQERAIALHGSFRISKPIETQQGTMITVKLPI
jgi:two-component system, NarL family, sensor histidine kinase UhpB